MDATRVRLPPVDLLRDLDQVLLFVLQVFVHGMPHGGHVHGGFPHGRTPRRPLEAHRVWHGAHRQSPGLGCRPFPHRCLRCPPVPRAACVVRHAGASVRHVGSRLVVWSPPGVVHDACPPIRETPAALGQAGPEVVKALGVADAHAKIVGSAGHSVCHTHSQVVIGTCALVIRYIGTVLLRM